MKEIFPMEETLDMCYYFVGHAEILTAYKISEDRQAYLCCASSNGLFVFHCYGLEIRRSTREMERWHSPVRQIGPKTTKNAHKSKPKAPKAGTDEHFGTQTVLAWSAGMTQEEKYDESDAKQAAKGTPEWTEVIQNRQKRIRKWIPGAMAEKVLKRTPPDM